MSKISNLTDRRSDLGVKRVLRLLVLPCVLLGCSRLLLAQAGVLDSTLATHGIFTTNFAACCGSVGALALQSDGRILVGGQVRSARILGLRVSP